MASFPATAFLALVALSRLTRCARAIAGPTGRGLNEHALTASAIVLLAFVSMPHAAQAGQNPSPPSNAAAPEAAVPAFTPRWGTIGAGEAYVRAGPGRNFPILWVYRRAGLPVMVLAAYENWRKVQDPEGTVGWIQSSLLTGRRAAIVVGKAIVPVYAKADAGSGRVWSVEPGVSGWISACEQGWCAFEVKGRSGFIESSKLWGLSSGEILP